MTAWDLASFAAFAVGGLPPLYFAIKLRAANPTFSRLSLLLASAFFVHCLFHVLRALEGPRPEVLAVETASALLVLAFALAYWPLRRRDSPAS